MIKYIKLFPYEERRSTLETEKFLFSFLDKFPTGLNLVSTESTKIRTYAKDVTRIISYKERPILVMNLASLNSEIQRELFRNKGNLDIYIYSHLPQQSYNLMDCWWDYFKDNIPEQLL